MIPDVDASLSALVQRDVLDGADVDVSFEPPTAEWAGKRQRPALNLFLYDIHEDLERRQTQPVAVRDDDGRVVGRAPPPRFFDLSYLVTAWTQRAEDEHRLLSLVMAAFLAADVLPGEVLQGYLADYAGHVHAQLAVPSEKEHSPTDIWLALGADLRPSLELQVSAPFDLGRVRAAGPPVTAGLRVRLAADGDPTAAVTADRRGDTDGLTVDEAGVAFDEDGRGRRGR